MVLPGPGTSYAASYKCQTTTPLGYHPRVQHRGTPCYHPTRALVLTSAYGPTRDLYSALALEEGPLNLLFRKQA
eukprot:2330660-Rhodomonas_salina.2